MGKCKLCGRAFKRRKSESNYAYARRTHCSDRCRDELNRRDRPSGLHLASRGLWEAAGRALAGKESDR